MTPDDAAGRIEGAFVLLARSLDTLTQQVSALAKPTQALLEVTRRLGYLIAVGYVLTFLGLVGTSVIVWQVWGLSRANQDLHQQTRTVVQTNQALLTELLGRTTRQP